MTSVQASLEGVSVMVGMPAGRDLPVQAVNALLASHDACVKRNIPISAVFISGCAIITKARDDVVGAFLKSDATHLFCIDSDMVWSADDFIRLLAMSKLAGVVCGAYPAKLDPVTYFIKYNERGMESGPFGLLSIEGCGLGFAVIPRHVVEQLAEKAESVYDGVSGEDRLQIFRTDTLDGEFRSEDMAFFADIRELGHNVWLDTGVNLSHMGTKQYTGSIKDALGIKSTQSAVA